MSGLLFFIGASLSSFVACLGYRLSRHITLAGFSVCDECGRRIKWYYLIPVIGFLFSGGNCDNCANRIPFRYPMYELVGGFLFIYQDWSVAILFLMLVFLSEEDLYDQTSSSLLMIPFIVWLFFAREWEWVNFIIFFALMAFSLGTSLIFKKLGSGDIPVLLILFLIQTPALFWINILLSSLFAMSYIYYHQEKSVPFIPFLTWGFVSVQLVNLFIQKTPITIDVLNYF